MASPASRKDGVLIERLGPLYWPLYISLLAITAIGTLFSGVAMAATHDHQGHDRGHDAVAAVLQVDADCTTPKQTVAVNLGDSGFSDQMISAHLCDTLQVKNTSSDPIHMAIGQHEKHATYPGFAEQTVQPGDTTVIVLRAAGDFEIHDHLHDEHTASISIRK